MLSPLWGTLGPLGRSRGTAVTYLLYDQFTTSASAPLGTRTCEPGPGTLTVTDTNNIISIASGRLTINGTPTTVDKVVTGTQARQAGRAFLVALPTMTNMGAAGGSVRIGWATAAGNSLDYGADYGAGTFRVKTGVSAIRTVTITDTEQTLACIMRGTGGWLLRRTSATTGDYTLEWVYNAGTASELTEVYLNNANAMNFTADDWRITDLGAPWTTDFGPATSYSASSSANQTATQTADAIVEHTITAATGVTQELRVRWTDDNNCWIVRMSQAGSTIALIEKVAGVETSRSSVAQTWTNGTAYRVVVVCAGTTITTFVANVQKNTYASASSNQTATTAKVDTAGTTFACWPRTLTLPAV